MINTNKKDFKFFPMVEALESILGSESNPIALISLISEDKFLQLRKQIIAFFDAGVEIEFTGEFGEEVEFGDMSDAVRETTFSLHPPESTEIFKDISLEERKIWCEKIVESMDAAACYY